MSLPWIQWPNYCCYEATATNICLYIKHRHQLKSIFWMFPVGPFLQTTLCTHLILFCIFLELFHQSNSTNPLEYLLKFVYRQTFYTIKSEQMLKIWPMQLCLHFAKTGLWVVVCPFNFPLPAPCVGKCWLPRHCCNHCLWVTPGVITWNPYICTSNQFRFHRKKKILSELHHLMILCFSLKNNAFSYIWESWIF